MAVNVPLVHISDLAEQTTAADTDLMVIGGTDAKKIKLSTIISLIKTKLNIGSSAISGIGDGTITGAISSLNSASSAAVSTTYFSAISFCKVGRIVFCMFITPKNLPPNSQTLIGTIPNKWYPKDVLNYDFREPASTDTIRLMLGVDGKLQIYNYTNRTNEFNISGEIVYYV